MARKVAPAPFIDAFTEHLEVLDLATLRPHPRNDGMHPPDEIAHLKQSLTLHGVYRNVVVSFFVFFVDRKTYGTQSA